MRRAKGRKQCTILTHEAMTLSERTTQKAEQLRTQLLGDGYFTVQIVYGGVVVKYLLRHQHTGRHLSLYVHKNAGLVQLYENKRTLKEIIV